MILTEHPRLYIYISEEILKVKREVIIDLFFVTSRAGLNQKPLLQEDFFKRIRYAMKPDEAYELIFSWDNVVFSAGTQALKLSAWKELAIEEERLKSKLSQLYSNNLLKEPMEGLKEWLDAVSTARIPGAVVSSLDRRIMVEITLVNRMSEILYGYSVEEALRKTASKVKSKMKTGENNIDHDFVPLDLTHNVSSTNEHFTDNPAPDSNDGSENRCEMPNVLSSKAKAWMDRKGIAWPWKNNENGGSFDGRTGRFVWPWLHNSQEDELGSIDSLKVDRQMYETASNTTGDPNSLSSSCDTSSSRSTNNYGQKFDIIAIDNLDVEILWNDLIVREQIGQDDQQIIPLRYGPLIQSLTNNYAGKNYETRLYTLKEKVRTVISDGTTVEYELNTLGLVDDLQRIGISYHFTDEISNVLMMVYMCYYEDNENLNTLDINQ
ncbi:PAS domain-containing protein tyrosine kinase family protein [Tanacetum coccineum]